MAKQNPLSSKATIKPVGGIINPIEVMKINSINTELLMMGLNPSSNRLIAGTRNATFFIKKSNFINNLFKTSIASKSVDIVGIWIWLIKEGAETKIIVTRANKAIAETIIPELELRYQIHRNTLDGFTENYIENNDMTWKNLKKNEGFFNGIRGFFMGKGKIQSELDKAATEGIQFEVWQRSDGSPTIFANRVFNRTLTEHIGSTLPEIFVTGASCSRPSPPYGE